MTKKLTPMMKQYFGIKERYEDSILFFRMGDFYEMFYDDAITASRELEIALTGRNKGAGEKAPMCGVPFHSADAYISKLVSKGYKVAICEQVEDPAEARGIVERDVVRVVTPGTITDEKVLDEKSNNYLCCVFMDEDGLGLAYVDITTGEFLTTETKGDEIKLKSMLVDELAKINPSEIITTDYLYEDEFFMKSIKTRFNVVINRFGSLHFDEEIASRKIAKQLKVITLDGYGLTNRTHCIKATSALLDYLEETQKTTLSHMNNIISYSMENYMLLDINTRRNLELTETMRVKSKKGSLLWVLDNTKTAMGGRLLKKWIEEPLLDVIEINKRLSCIEHFTDDLLLMDEIKELLSNIYDIERLIGKISYGNCNGRDMIALKNSIEDLPKLKSLLINSGSSDLEKMGNAIDTLEDVYEIIEKSIIEEAPVGIKDGGVIKHGFNEELDELLDISTNGKQWLARLEEEEKNQTGIKSLKIGYNKVFGYYIEVTRSNLKLVPETYIRKQTLSNAERYITPELKEMESKILGAQEKIVKLEYEIFAQIRELIKAEIIRIQSCSKLIANIDVLNSLAQVAYKNNYVKPVVNTTGSIDIKDGRHPVVEKMLDGELFVPNDTYLNGTDNRFSIITGPNMAGKSTYMRQVALIALMAQIGSFVPAREVSIGVVDRIFTRVGASDDLSQGQSTFMVEMSEMANILNNSTQKSLVILDEIGRGTSTYDGLSIAWSVVEYLSDTKLIGAKTLFATHYHELTELENKLPGVKNYRVMVDETDDDIIFLRKIARGGSDRSYGIEVAKIAGVPDAVVNRAKEILHILEERDINNNIENLKESLSNNVISSSLEVKEDPATLKTVLKEEDTQEKEESYQLNLFDSNDNNDELVKIIKEIDLMNTTPLDAMNILYTLVKEVKDKSKN